MPGDEKTQKQFLDDLNEVSKINAEVIANAAERMSSYATEINKTFGQGRQRIEELSRAIEDAQPGIDKLGGNISDVSNIMTGVAEASRRNVIANSEDVSKLFAATKILGGSAKELTESFAKVGISLEQFPKQLESSIQYIQSIGGNTKQVINTVTANLDQLNRFQFEGGVQGLTKMAAQASMLRFDMKQTFDLADKVLDPEKAVEVASAFQRLGVSAGNLVDPFQLMNQSINDPAGLQKSLADVSKQFTYFDEKTKSFKINPQGVLTLRAMEAQTGVSAKEMSKLGLAAAELDDRISKISPNIVFENEEDKQYLANIAKMEDGEYKVTLDDGTKKELADITQPEIDKLIEEQKNGPKTLEAFAKDQMGVTEIISGNVKAIRDAFVGGIVSSKQVTGALEGGRRISQTTTDALSNNLGNTPAYRKQSETLINNMEEFMKNLSDKGVSGKDALKQLADKFGKQYEDIQKQGQKSINDIAQEIVNKTTDKTAAERLLKKSVTSAVESTGGVIKPTVVGKSAFIEGSKSKELQQTAASVASGGSTDSGQVDVGGKITVDIQLPANFANLSTQQQQQFFDSAINNPKFQNYILGLTKPSNPTKQNSNT